MSHLSMYLKQLLASLSLFLHSQNREDRLKMFKHLVFVCVFVYLYSPEGKCIMDGYQQCELSVLEFIKERVQSRELQCKRKFIWCAK